MPMLAVVGAGPKGIAIAAKARALAAAGLDAPRVVLIDRGPVAGNWTGQRGYTSGLLPLGTLPEKDIGFPYADSWGTASAAVTRAMADYSWPRHLIAHGTYADWVDRGRLRPTHRQWSLYLREVAAKAEAEKITDTVVSVESAGDRWRLALARGAPLEADGVVFTGPGPPIRVPGQPAEPPAGGGRAQLLAARQGRRAAGRPERVCHRERRDRGLGDHQLARYGAEALCGRRRDQPRGALLPGRKLRGEPASTPTPATGRSWPSTTGANSSTGPTAVFSPCRPRR